MRYIKKLGCNMNLVSVCSSQLCMFLAIFLLHLLVTIDKVGKLKEYLVPERSVSHYIYISGLLQGHGHSKLLVVPLLMDPWCLKQNRKHL